jgi:uncharacterized protein YfaS (alpha-2-macroglobulin family)
VSLAPQPGRYRLDVKSTEADGPVTSVQFDVGWYSDGSADTPDLLETSIDKPEYAVRRHHGGVGQRAHGRQAHHQRARRPLLTTRPWTSRKAPSRSSFPSARTGAPAPMCWRRCAVRSTRGAADAGRAIGLKWFGIDKKTRTLQVDLSPPPLVRPGTALKIPVKLGGLNPGEDAKIVVAAVDVGILNLTNYKPPAPDDYYLGQRRLTSEIRDLYGQLIDGMQGTRGQIKTGGDSAGAELQGSPPTQKPLALYSGIVTVGADGPPRSASTFRNSPAPRA